MYVTTTELQNNFGKYLKLCERHTIIVTKNGKKRAVLLPFPRGEHGYEAAEPEHIYGTAARKPDFVPYQEYLRLTENSEDRYEYIDGVIYLMSSPGFTHQQILGRLHLLFQKVFSHNQPEDQGCEVFLSPFDTYLYHLPIKEERELTEDDTNVVQPDLLVLCDHHTTVDEHDRYKGTPALVVEILSPSTRSKDKLRKLVLYAESGIREYWIVDPHTSSISVYSFADCALRSDTHYSEDQTAISDTFTDLQVPLRHVFG
ncbi:type II toxin-antitoxin system Phd/YefM family antitoxin [Spirochaeta africana]|uniref:Prevent-host-death family protein n=1 Tax=Spirochaeta africana (strain ATCC 700263 / DSM 8902 / Z-7692) TaxID=889378 RepID=H9UG59_SPIAZ|nr:type II toxin-antitoxin system Phd/YefM family antitoxin [Spirochaeta africana]AFG36502.1 prevent-host-death family protein [Spirochaeta africana DSM 8902]